MTQNASSLKFKQVFAVVVSLAFAVSAIFMMASAINDISTGMALNIAVALKVVCACVALSFSWVNFKMVTVTRAHLARMQNA
ncbi:MAG: hypothetical protein ACPGMR_05710 [Pontibacterium sp.]